MKIAIISGKGGTGKTFVATNLAKALDTHGADVWYVDADVEEPNGHLFLHPEILHTEAVNVAIPVINRDFCTMCGACVSFCQFHALLFTPRGLVTFPNLCHGCGGCMMVCEEHAITEEDKSIGTIEYGKTKNLHFLHGIVHIGEPRAVPVIKALKRFIGKRDGIFIIDGPPGTSCPVVEILQDSDACILVTEPTPFGLHDLTLAVEMVRKLEVPAHVIVNKSDIGSTNVHEYCAREKLPILMEIPFRREFAEIYSTGKLLIDAFPEWIEKFTGMYERVSRYCREVMQDAEGVRDERER